MNEIQTRYAKVTEEVDAVMAAKEWRSHYHP